MTTMQTFRNLIRVNISSLQVSFASDVIFRLWRIPCNMSLDTHDTSSKVSEVLSRALAQRN